MDGIDRFSPDVKVEVSGNEHTFSYGNTDIFQFGRGYGMFDHIYYHETEDYFIFNCDDLIKALIAHDFPHHHFPYPPEDVVEFYLSNTASTIDQEMGKIDEG
jgi:hypothetical protein